jgi:hypothetical protein
MKPRTIFTALLSLAIFSGLASQPNVMVDLNSVTDSFYIRLPSNYDTLNVNYIKKNFTRIIFDKYSLKNYSAPDGLYLDMQRTSAFAISDSELPITVKSKIIDVPSISDSLISQGAKYIKRHQFFVVSEKTKGAYYFYRTRVEYLHKEE